MKLHRSQCETPLPLLECPSSVNGTETLGTFRVRPSCLGSLFLLVLVYVPQKPPVDVLSPYFVNISALLEWASLVRTLERIDHAQESQEQNSAASMHSAPCRMVSSAELDLQEDGLEMGQKTSHWATPP